MEFVQNWTSATSNPSLVPNTTCAGWHDPAQADFVKSSYLVLFSWLTDKGERQYFDACALCNQSFLEEECNFHLQESRAKKFLVKVDSRLFAFWSKTMVPFFQAQRAQRLATARDILDPFVPLMEY